MRSLSSLPLAQLAYDSLQKSAAEIGDQVEMLTLDVQLGRRVDVAISRLCAIEQYARQATDALSRLPVGERLGCGSKGE